jgi:hypothetical protein
LVLLPVIGPNNLDFPLESDLTICETSSPGIYVLSSPGSWMLSFFHMIITILIHLYFRPPLCIFLVFKWNIPYHEWILWHLILDVKLLLKMSVYNLVFIRETRSQQLIMWFIQWGHVSPCFLILVGSIMNFLSSLTLLCVRAQALIFVNPRVPFYMISWMLNCHRMRISLKPLFHMVGHGKICITNCSFFSN